jgi:flagellin
LNNEFNDIVSEITRELSVASLGTSNAFSVFVSNESTASNGVVTGTIAAVTAGGLGISGLDLTSDAAGAVSAVTSAITTLGTAQGQVGQLQNRLSYAVSLAQSQVVNNRAAESRIRDANIAEESSNLTRFSILNQSGLAALAQANQSTAAVLALLR